MLLLALAVGVSQAGAGYRWFAGTVGHGGVRVDNIAHNTYNTRAWSTGNHVCSGIEGIETLCSSDSVNEITVYLNATGKPRCKNLSGATQTLHCWYNYP
jgi:hypothetical protein